MNAQNTTNEMIKFCLVSGPAQKEIQAESWESAQAQAREWILDYNVGNQTDEWAEDLVIDCTIQEIGIDDDGDEYIVHEECTCLLVEQGEKYRPKCEGPSHKWTRQGFGGCKENPGVWSRGVEIIHLRRCVLCNLIEEEVYNSQSGLSAFHWTYRNPENGICEE